MTRCSCPASSKRTAIPWLSGIGTQAPAHWIAPYVGYETWHDVEALFAKLDAETPAGQGLMFNGLDRLLQQVAEPTNTDLDVFFPHRPVCVLDNSGHELYFNSAMIEMVGWTDHKPPPDPAGARFGRNADGTSNGRAYEVAATFAVVDALMAKVIPHPLLSAAQWYQLMAKNGITATSDMTYSTDMLKGYLALASGKDCPLRISLYHMSIDDDAGEKLGVPVPDAMLRKQGIKLWADGSPWVGTIANSYPYLDTETVRNAGIPLGPGGESMMNYTRAQLDEILAKYAPMGWQMAFHVNGDVGLDIVLDAYEKALIDNHLMGTDHRWLSSIAAGAGGTSSGAQPRWASRCRWGRSSSSTGATCSTGRCSRRRSGRSGCDGGTQYGPVPESASTTTGWSVRRFRCSTSKPQSPVPHRRAPSTVRSRSSVSTMR